MSSDAPDTSYNAADLVFDPPANRTVDDKSSDVRNIDDLKKLSKQLSMRFIDDLDDIVDESGDDGFNKEKPEKLNADDRGQVIARFLDSSQPVMSADKIEEELEYCQYYLEMFTGFNHPSPLEDERRNRKQLDYTRTYVQGVWKLTGSQNTI